MTKNSMVLGAAVAVGSLMALGQHADAAAITTFTFETIPPTTSAVVADQGAGTGLVNTGGAISNPAGNAVGATVSNESFSSAGWDVGEYYQFSVPTTGFEDITVGFDATGSNTGPRDFSFAYSTNGTTFTNFATYTLTNDSWNATTDVAASAKFFDLSAITAVDNIALLTIRLIDASTTAITGGTVASTGTSRVDNVVISGTALVVAPEPASLSLLGFGAAAMLGRRRKA